MKTWRERVDEGTVESGIVTGKILAHTRCSEDTNGAWKESPRTLKAMLAAGIYRKCTMDGVQF